LEGQMWASVRWTAACFSRTLCGPCAGFFYFFPCAPLPLLLAAAMVIDRPVGKQRHRHLPPARRPLRTLWMRGQMFPPTPRPSTQPRTPQRTALQTRRDPHRPARKTARFGRRAPPSCIQRRRR
jgi:hypothetical protein